MVTTLTDGKGDTIFIKETVFIKLIDNNGHTVYIKPDEVVRVKRATILTKFGYKKGKVKTKPEYGEFIELTLRYGGVETIDMKCKEIIEEALYIKL